MNLQPKPNEESWKVLVFLLKEGANEKKITHLDIATALDMKESSISRFFSAKFSPSTKLLVNVATVIGFKIFIEDTSGNSDLSVLFEKAMTELGRRKRMDNLN